jgi:SAM-dependent methyltransferase
MLHCAVGRPDDTISIRRERSENVMNDNDQQLIAAGYDAVYAATPRSPTLAAIWRKHALGPDYPEGFEHISFLTLAELRMVADELRLDANSRFVDLACGLGGPGLWVARETGAQLTGVDLSPVAVAGARDRAARLGLSAAARFSIGTFAETGLGDAAFDAAMSADALQYAPDKEAALVETARILRPGGRLVFACFEVEAERVAGLPVLGTDPIGDYRPLLDRAGFDVSSYAETTNWRKRMTGAYQGIINAKPSLTEEMGDAGYSALFGEVSLTLQIQPYSSRVFVSAIRR